MASDIGDGRRSPQQRSAIADPTRVLDDPSLTRPSEAQPAESPSASRRFEAGTVLARRYRIENEIGAGGMGQVYRAWDLQLDQAVALKFLPPELARDARAKARLLEEVRLAREVSHPNVCRVYDVVIDNDLMFISMELIEGENLHSLLNRIGRPSVDKALELAHQLCIGLAAAHARGVLHRDLKPANVMIDQAGRARLTDFGLASRSIGAVHEVTTGTPAYMAPEQIAGLEYTVRSDLYALGLTLFELFTGQRAFQAQSFAEYKRLHEASSPTPPSSLVPELDPTIERAILHCLEKLPSDRPVSALAVAAELPGGDPLQAALAAGETPSPELVAAAGETHSARARTVWFELGGVLAMLGLLLALTHLATGPDGAALTKNPAVLADRARDIVYTLGLADYVQDSAVGLTTSTDAPFGLTATRRTGFSDATRIGAAEDVAFWYRGAPAMLTPEGARNLLFNGARIRLNDPPASEAGTIDVVMDRHGWLRSVTLPQLKNGPALTNETSRIVWEPIIAAAGLDRSSLTREAVKTTTPEGFVTLIWEGPRVGALTRERVQLVARSDHLGLRTIETLLLATTADTVQNEQSKARWQASNEYEQFLWLLITAAAVPVARLNLRRNRTDRRGAARLAVFVLIVVGAIWVLQAHHVLDVQGELRLVFFAAVGAMVLAAVAWCLYAAVEPYLRRFWPQALISWSRVLTGRWHDPLVGQHLLIGVLLGCYFGVLARLDRLIVVWLHLDASPVLFDADALSILLNPRHAAATTLSLLLRSVYTGILFLIVIVFLQKGLRRRTLALAIAVTIFSILYVPRSGDPRVGIFTFGLGAVVVAVWAMLRFGLLTIVAAGFVMNILLAFPVAPDLHAWTAGLSGFAVMLAIAIAALGVWLARRPGASHVAAARAYGTVPSR